MQNSQIVPDVVDHIGATIVPICYANGLQVLTGHELTPRQVKDAPHISWAAATEAGAFYTLILCDPDAPAADNPLQREVLHWCVVNIPGGDQFAGGQTLFEYIGSGAPAGTGLHRYVFLLFRQPSGQQVFSEEHVPRTSRKNRRLTAVREFAQRHQLGSPIGGNYFLAQYDDYVPEFRKQFTD